jgi:hypothetical protein
MGGLVGLGSDKDVVAVALRGLGELGGRGVGLVRSRLSDTLNWANRSCMRRVLHNFPGLHSPGEYAS